MCALRVGPFGPHDVINPLGRAFVESVKESIVWADKTTKFIPDSSTKTFAKFVLAASHLAGSPVKEAIETTSAAAESNNADLWALASAQWGLQILSVFAVGLSGDAAAKGASKGAEVFAGVDKRAAVAAAEGADVELPSLAMSDMPKRKAIPPKGVPRKTLAAKSAKPPKPVSPSFSFADRVKILSEKSEEWESFIKELDAFQQRRSQAGRISDENSLAVHSALGDILNRAEASTVRDIFAPARAINELSTLERLSSANAARLFPQLRGPANDMQRFIRAFERTLESSTATAEERRVTRSISARIKEVLENPLLLEGENGKQTVHLLTYREQWIVDTSSKKSEIYRQKLDALDSILTSPPSEWAAKSRIYGFQREVPTWPRDGTVLDLETSADRSCSMGDGAVWTSSRPGK